MPSATFGLWYAASTTEKKFEIEETRSHTPRTIMSVQAALKAPFRVGTKEVYLYVLRQPHTLNGRTEY